MTAQVYKWPHELTANMLYDDGFRTRVTPSWSGAPAQITAEQQRVRVEVSGETVRRNASQLDIFLNRLRGGLNLALLFDAEMRIANGWANRIVVNDGNDSRAVWNEDGGRGAYIEGEEAPFGGTPSVGGWRQYQVSATAASAGDTQITATGFFAGEVIPFNTTLRIGVHRYKTLGTVTTTGSSGTFLLSHPLEADVAGGDRVYVPGDFLLGQLSAPPNIGASNADGLRSFALSFFEVFEDELPNGWEFANLGDGTPA